MITMGDCSTQGCAMPQAMGNKYCLLHGLPWPAWSVLKRKSPQPLSAIGYAYRAFSVFGTVPCLKLDPSTGAAHLHAMRYSVQIDPGPLRLLSPDSLEGAEGMFIIGAASGDENRFHEGEPIVILAGKVTSASKDGSEAKMSHALGVTEGGSIKALIDVPVVCENPGRADTVLHEAMLYSYMCSAPDELPIGLYALRRPGTLPPISRFDIPAGEGEYQQLASIENGSFTSNVKHQQQAVYLASEAAGWGFTDAVVEDDPSKKFLVGYMPSLNEDGTAGGSMAFSPMDGNKGAWVPYESVMTGYSVPLVRPACYVKANLGFQCIDLRLQVEPPEYVIRNRLPAVLTAMSGSRKVVEAALQMAKAVRNVLECVMLQTNLHSVPRVWFLRVREEEDGVGVDGEDGTVFGNPSSVPRIMGIFGGHATAACEVDEGLSALMVWHDIGNVWGIVHASLPVQVLVDMSSDRLFLLRMRPSWLLEVKPDFDSFLDSAAAIFGHIGLTARPTNRLFR